MVFTKLSFGFQKWSMDRTHLRAWGGRLFFRAFEFGFLALLWGPPSFQGWNLALRSLDFPTCAAIYCPFVLFSLLFLGFSVWRLVRRFEELRVCGCSRCSRCSKGSEEPVVDTIGSPKWGYRNCNGREGVRDLLDESEEEEGDENGKEEEGSDGDEVMKLIKVIEKATRIRAKVVRELEKERIAAASAAEEAMAKIFWLQNEKNFVEREARQYREIAEQKKAYDQQYIEQLQWHIEKLESEKRGDSSRWAEDRGYGE